MSGGLLYGVESEGQAPHARVPFSYVTQHRSVGVILRHSPSMSWSDLAEMVEESDTDA